MKATYILVLGTTLLATCSGGFRAITAVPVETRIAFTPTALSPNPTQTQSNRAGTDLFNANGITLAPASCAAGPTPAQTEGPYFTAGSPERNSLYTEGAPGRRLIVAGFVMDGDCRPLQNAMLDFWQADAGGAYDNQGYNMRGRQFTDGQGRYFLETVVPGEYPGRTPHIHVKVRPEGGALLTTQLYFPNAASNAADGIFTAATLVSIEDRGEFLLATYTFVLNAP